MELPLTVERHLVATARLERDDRIPFGHGDLVTGYYCRPEGADHYLMGWTHAEPPVDPDDFDRSLHREEELALINAVARRYPAMHEAEPRGGWASLYDVSPDWQPVIGEIADGVFVDAGTSGHGFKLAPALGRHVANLVLGNSRSAAGPVPSPPLPGRASCWPPAIATPASWARACIPYREPGATCGPRSASSHP